jgi:tetratricopeptide (TPR) repeat protein
MRRFVTLAAGVAIGFQVLSAQKAPAGAPSSPNPNMTGTAGAPTASSLNRDIYLSGKVMLDDGTPLPEPAKIERVCVGTPRGLAYTDEKGVFAFQLGHTASVDRDAGEGDATARLAGAPRQQQYDVPDAQLSNCYLRAVLAGFRSDVISLGARRLTDGSNIGTILLHRLAGVQGKSVSVTTLEAPKDARKAYDRGLQFVQQSRLADAERNFQQAVDIYPNFAAAWYELGKVQQHNREIEPARQSYAKAVAADSKLVGPYEQLVQLAVDTANWRELADASQRLLDLDPEGHPTAYFYNAVANLNLNRIDLAEKDAWAGEKLDSQHRYPKREQVLAMILAKKRDYAGAAEHMRVYLQYAPDAEDAARMREQLAEYERLIEPK